MEESRQTGTVKWFNSTKGYGFITPSDGTGDLFVHQTDIQAEGFRSLAEGEEVEYVAQTGNDGRMKAVQVTGPGGAAPRGAPRQGGFGGGGGGGGFGGRGGGGYGGGGGYRDNGGYGGGYGGAGGGDYGRGGYGGGGGY